MPFSVQIDMVGAKVGHLTVIRSAPKTRHYAMWLCRCVCGQERVVSGINLRNGAVRSCGRNHDELRRLLPKPPDPELAWAAGLFEGEGSVRISKPTPRNWSSLNVDVPNTDEQIVRFFSDRWAGSVHFTDPLGRHKGFWRWRIAARQAALFLTDIRPFVRTNRMQQRINHGLAFQGQKSMRSDEDYRQQQWEAYWWMAELNVRGNRQAQQEKTK